MYSYPALSHAWAFRSLHRAAGIAAAAVCSDRTSAIMAHVITVAPVRDCNLQTAARDSGTDIVSGPINLSAVHRRTARRAPPLSRLPGWLRWCDLLLRAVRLHPDLHICKTDRGSGRPARILVETNCTHLSH